MSHSDDVQAHFKIDATSMIRGMSNEKPAEHLVLCILSIWSAYDVMGAVAKLHCNKRSSAFPRCFSPASKSSTHKNGAAYSTTKERSHIVSKCRAIESAFYFPFARTRKINILSLKYTRSSSSYRWVFFDIKREWKITRRKDRELDSEAMPAAEGPIWKTSSSKVHEVFGRKRVDRYAVVRPQTWIRTE